MAKLQTIIELIISKINNNELGKSGKKFLSIKEIQENYNVSYVSASRILHALENQGKLLWYNKQYYILNGIYSKQSDLYNALNYKSQITIGLLLRTLANPFFSSLADIIAKQAKKNNVSLIIMTSNDDSDEEKNILNLFIKMGCKGVISFIGNSVNELLDYYNSYPLPMVLLGQEKHQLKIDTISTDNYFSGFLAAKHLVECGYSVFGFLDTTKKSLSHNDRYSGFIDGLRDKGLSIDENFYLQLDMNNDVQIENYVSKIRKKISTDETIGIFCYHDLLAIKLMTSCMKYKIDIPNKIGIIGYDDLDVCTTIIPTLTTFSYNFSSMASAAVITLLKKIENLQLDKINLRIQTYLMIRESTMKIKK